MFRKLLIPAAVVAAAFTPTIASAQSFGFNAGPGSPGYYSDDERREAWAAHERYEQHERWGQEQARRQYWQHQRWERDHEDRRNWDRDRWEHRHDRHHGDDDDDD
jgi:hypothetical protein